MAEPTDMPAPTPPEPGSPPWSGPWAPPPGRGSWPPNPPANGWREPRATGRPPTPARPDRNPLPPPRGPRRTLATELFFVLLLAFAPGLLGLLILAASGGQSAGGDVRLVPAIVTTIIDLALQWSPVLVIGLLLRRAGDGWAGIGLGRLGRREAWQGATLWVASWLLVYVLALLLSVFGEREVDFLPKALPLWFRVVDAVTIAATAGVTEEITVRGYAQTRLEQLRAPAAVIILLPTALWGFLHLYQGPGAALTIFGLGIMYAVYFHRTRRLWPLILAHALFDLTQLALILAGF